MRASLVVASVVVALALSGCTGGSDDGDGGPDPTDGSPTPAPAESATLVSRSQASGDVAMAPNPFEQDFKVEEPYDELVVSFHVSGVGTYRLVVEDAVGAVIHDSGDEVSATQPDTHPHNGEGPVYNATAGEYSVELTFNGAITYHLDIIAKQHRTDAMHEH